MLTSFEGVLREQMTNTRIFFEARNEPVDVDFRDS